MATPEESPAARSDCGWAGSAPHHQLPECQAQQHHRSLLPRQNALPCALRLSPTGLEHVLGLLSCGRMRQPQPQQLQLHSPRPHLATRHSAQPLLLTATGPCAGDPGMQRLMRKLPAHPRPQKVLLCQVLLRLLPQLLHMLPRPWQLDPPAAWQRAAHGAPVAGAVTGSEEWPPWHQGLPGQLGENPTTSQAGHRP